jgi:hypothetical protein
MKKLLIAAMFAASPAFADLVARNGKNELRLMDMPCVHGGILGQLKEEWRPKFKKAMATVQGKTHYACWIDTGDGAYYTIWEDGTGAAYPVEGFVDEPGV